MAFVGCKKGAPEKESEALQLLRIIWIDIMKKPKTEIDTIIRGPPDLVKQDNKSIVTKTNSSRIRFVAAETGNTKFLVELIRKYPDLIWKVNDKNQSIFHILSNIVRRVSTTYYMS